MASAREFADKKDYFKAAAAARRALRMSPKDLAANRLMAEMAEAVQAKEAVSWRKTIAEMQPGVAKNYLDWAETALLFRDTANASEALSRLDEAGKNTAAYHEMAARVAVQTGRSSEVYAHVTAAAQLEPQNENYQLQLAAVQLGSPLQEIRKGARARVEQLAESPKVRRQALRMLIQAALSERDGAGALKFANDLMTGPNGLFEDRVLYLKLLGYLKRPEYWWFLAQLGSELPESDDDLVTLLSWMNNNGLPLLTLNFIKQLPNDRTERANVSPVIAEAHALTGGWGKLKSILRFQKWGELEFQREALTARVAQNDGDDTGAHSHWAAAMALAGERREALGALGRFAQAWKWDEEYTNVVWAFANGRDHPMSALQELLGKFTSEGKTRGILRVFNRMLELDPQNLNAKNNVAYALLILNMEPDRAQKLAYEARTADPANPEYSATYALALNAKGKTDAAYKILQGLDATDRRSPATALCFGVVLAAQGKNDEARAFLDEAEKGALLPEEKMLAAKTREKRPR